MLYRGNVLMMPLLFIHDMKKNNLLDYVEIVVVQHQVRVVYFMSYRMVIQILKYNYTLGMFCYQVQFYIIHVHNS